MSEKLPAPSGGGWVVVAHVCVDQEPLCVAAQGWSQRRSPACVQPGEQQQQAES